MTYIWQALGRFWHNDLYLASIVRNRTHLGRGHIAVVDGRPTLADPQQFSDLINNLRHQSAKEREADIAK